MNLAAPALSANDTYRYNPWRAPGLAPVFDACGMAGGTVVADQGPGEAIYVATPLAAPGDLGSQALFSSEEDDKVLDLMPPVWRPGSTVDVAWGIRFNHGGGYQYRLCPRAESFPPTEACFQRHPLDFVRGAQTIVWTSGPNASTRYVVGGTFVDEGTHPPGSTWAMNPIPRINFDSTSSGQPAGAQGCWPDPATGGAEGPQCRQFDPPCPQDDGWVADPTNGTDRSGQGACSGDFTDGIILDRVVVPADVPPGPAVLGWRWDCEETSQVWSNCADVLVTVAATSPSNAETATASLSEA